MRNSIWLLLFLSSFLLVSCDSNGVFDQYQSVPNSWHKDSIIGFKVNPPDSLNVYNLFVNLRNNNEYKYNNLFLIVELNYPHGKTIKDTLLYKMAKPNGEFLGSGFSSIKLTTTPSTCLLPKGILTKPPISIILSICGGML